MDESTLAVELLTKYSKAACADDERWDKTCARLGHRQGLSTNFQFEAMAMTANDLLA